MKARRHMLAVEAFDVPGLPEGARKGGWRELSAGDELVRDRRSLRRSHWRGRKKKNENGLVQWRAKEEGRRYCQMAHSRQLRRAWWLWWRRRRRQRPCWSGTLTEHLLCARCCKVSCCLIFTLWGIKALSSHYSWVNEAPKGLDQRRDDLPATDGH